MIRYVFLGELLAKPILQAERYKALIPISEVAIQLAYIISFNAWCLRFRGDCPATIYVFVSCLIQ